MAHYALIDENNIVVQVITGRNEDEVVDGISDWEEYYGNFHGLKCKRTSYNWNLRKQFAGVGYSYDETNDIFVKPQPYPSWTLDENHDWQPPVPMPIELEMGFPVLYNWDEATLTWIRDVPPPPLEEAGSPE